MKAFAVAILSLAFIGLFGYLTWTPIQQAIAPKVLVPSPTNGVVVDFQSCADNDNPITESYPRTCRANGVTYTESTVETNPNGCRDDISCGKGKFCDQGLCQPIVYDTSCSTDNDCQLANQFVGWGCCYAGQCDPVDYSQDNWISVNSQKYTAGQTKYCPAKSACGTPPACPSSIKLSNFVAVCQQSTCVKTERIAPMPKINPPFEPAN